MTSNDFTRRRMIRTAAATAAAVGLAGCGQPEDDATENDTGSPTDHGETGMGAGTPTEEGGGAVGEETDDGASNETDGGTTTEPNGTTEIEEA